MLISKEEFVKTLEFIKSQDLKVDNFISALEALSPNTYCDCFLYSDYESKLLKILEAMFEDEHEDIEYFLYESNWIFENRPKLGLEVNFPTDDDGVELYNSPETLYDFLIAEKEKREHEKDN